MKKQLFLVALGFLIYSLGVIAYYQADKMAAQILHKVYLVKNNDITQTFCKKVETLQPLLSAYSEVHFPVVGIPGITLGIGSKSSIVEDTCNFLLKI